MYSKVTEVDASNRGNHHFIDLNDRCFYLGEYTARAGFTGGDTNQLIYNLKIPVDEQHRLNYKKQAIVSIAQSLQRAIPNPGLCTFVPVPPSRARNDPLYDDRMTAILREYQRLVPEVNYRELVIQNITTRSSHSGVNRLQPTELAQNYSINEALINCIHPQIIIFDDMLTTGSHFKAMQSLIGKHFPGSQIAGLFVARRAIHI